MNNHINDDSNIIDNVKIISSNHNSLTKSTTPTPIPINNPTINSLSTITNNTMIDTNRVLRKPIVISIGKKPKHSITSPITKSTSARTITNQSKKPNIERQYTSLRDLTNTSENS